jgi:starch synthase (maltosyl-transferring)
MMQSTVPVMIPAPGERLRRFAGDRVGFRLAFKERQHPPEGWRALLRTNLGRASELRREILEAHTRSLAPAGSSWRDIPMNRDELGWSLELPLAEVGYFKAKAYVVDSRGWQHWPDGPDIGISVHPDKYRTANIIYCAFARLFGPVPVSNGIREQEETLQAVRALDNAGYAVIPPSGKLRDLALQLPHIIDRLGCRILHLLPVNPTPSTYARFGRFGSPYAALDLTAIDPALVVLDKRTTGVDQFRELTYAAHLHGASVLLDIVINHTGWGSVLQEHHPEWFLRGLDNSFVSPGAWGVTWEDLIELKHQNVALWDKLSEIFLTWCQRGVDGFRCDAGYKVPVAAWQYIVARVQQEYPETVFLLEGLGGAWEVTEALLTEGGMQWAYSELFQNYTGAEVARYLDHSLLQTPRVGLLVHYSETHDNDRLAARGRAWSLLRNRLCALTSTAGGFGFTCGVEWLAAEKIRVHERTSLNWDSSENLVPELAKLNQLLADHPCFFDGSRLIRISPIDSPIYALLRESEDGQDQVLILVNNSVDQAATLGLGPDAMFSDADRSGGKLSDPAASARFPRGVLKLAQWLPDISPLVDLLEQALPKAERKPDGTTVFHLQPGAAYCLSPTLLPNGLHGEEYRRTRTQAAWALKAISHILPAESTPAFEWRDLALAVHQAPKRFLSALSGIGRGGLPANFLSELNKSRHAFGFPQVVTWTLLDFRRVTLVPPNHWLFVQDTARFRATLIIPGVETSQNVEAIPTSTGYVGCFPPGQIPADATLLLERYSETDPQVQASVRFLAPEPAVGGESILLAPDALRRADLVLLTNGRGGMARLCVDLGRVNSKYDCVLGANLHPTLPVDRHVFAKRIRAWVNADGFLSRLDFNNLRGFEPGPPAIWHFVANAGDGRTVEIQCSAEMLQGYNATVICFSRPTAAQASGKQLPDTADVRLTVRVDIEDRNSHWETKRNSGAEYHFSANTRPLPAGIIRGAEIAPGPAKESPEVELDRYIGFEFTPAKDRHLRVFADNGLYHPQPEWSDNIPHPIEQSRGQTGSGDAFSPGWFELPSAKGAAARLILTADPEDQAPQILISARDKLAPAASEGTRIHRGGDGSSPLSPSERDEPSTSAPHPRRDSFYERLLSAVRSFVVRRGEGKTVIAGYPWFLDWGRDTFICARGLLAAGLIEDVKQLLLIFGRFERDGTLPNTIFGEDASNRDTSDAPLWFGLACEELGTDLEALKPIPGRSIRDVLESIALNYIKGTPNGIRMDASSGLVWSPSHFTWMDTNYPACTPREGYPVEIQALWIRLLRHLTRLAKSEEQSKWEKLAAQAQASLEALFWQEEKGYYADVLLAGRGRSAQEAVVDDALRSNCLLVVSLGLSSGERGRRCVDEALRYLVVPGALRSLAPLPVSVPLANQGSDGRLLNSPKAPYWGRYEGDEDTRRKPAYHNGTAWTWTFPVFCEALARVWDFAPGAVTAARAYLGSVDRLMAEGCLGQLPEILDGDAPHTQRGCDAQAWGATEALRVWKLLR